MKGYCKSCKKQVQGKKKQFSYGCGWMTGWIPYMIYRLIAVSKNRCPICGLKISRGKRSNTTDKQTAQIAERKGRICQDCTEAIKKDPKIPIPADKETIWQKIKRLFK